MRNLIIKGTSGDLAISREEYRYHLCCIIPRVNPNSPRIVSDSPLLRTLLTTFISEIPRATMPRLVHVLTCVVSAVIAARMCVATVVMPEASASPEPDVADPMPVDPVSGMSLYIVPAGARSEGASGPVRRLGEAASVCPADYASGFSVECKSSNPTATFYVNGEGVRKEMAKPFYIAGDANRNVRPWAPPSGMSRVWVACKYGGRRVRSRISFVC